MDGARADHDEQTVVRTAQYAAGHQTAGVHRTGRGLGQRQLAPEVIGGTCRVRTRLPADVTRQ
ncbi:hypothetical protein BFF78_27060 [Streptomyces fodineus]|uniref:Uncharacterized protein n=1 Tax=Streptomyces fodineus TaxID=1904616 RepID=A0A1D7YFD0_9ACTN|nr:hypothetical protein [Streptomyces fodineus]AOR34226.1 hypothetical protein BFF78_27060 [Streptomyces fodineus]